MGISPLLSPADSKVDEYTLRLLLPSSLSEENVLGLMFVGEDGSVEFYPSAQRDMLMSVKLSHISELYLVAEQGVDLTPLIIFLLILFIFELVVFCFIIFLRYKRKRKETGMLPESFMYSLNPLLLTFALRIKPDGGAGLAVGLTVGVLALGCGIALLVRAELPFMRNRRRSGRRFIPYSGTSEPQSTLPKRSTPSLDRPRERLLREGSAGAMATACATVTEEETDSAFIVSEPPEEDAHTEPDGAALHKAEVNLDVIAQKFKDGELVDLDGLKRKHLVSKKTEYVKILARGALTKPLVVEAQDFSRAAEDMLRAIGGEAIRVAPELRTK
jgi:ribosomal protein L15